MNFMKTFDIIIIGKGLVGSAAAKYLSSVTDNIAIIGPDEPEDYKDAIVYASHYDQARVQRLIGKDEVWTRLNTDSAKQYPEIEAASGIAFHQAVGCLYVNPYGTDDYLKHAKAIGDMFELSFTKFDNGTALNNQFNDFDFPESSEGLLETAPAGLINPRLLIKAQLKIAKHQGVQIFNDTITDLTFKEGLFTAIAADGKSISAKKVLLATGSFLNFNNLITPKLSLKTKSEIILLAKMEEKDAQKLAQLPSLLYEIDENNTEGIYLVQPLLYPDGNYYLKMGCNIPEDLYFDNLQQVQHWFLNADTSIFETRLKNVLLQIIPHLNATDYHTKKCIISRTEHGRPYIGESMQQGLYIAGGCNGYSAMCSDAIGHAAAQIILTGHYPNGYTEKAFEIMYQ